MKKPQYRAGMVAITKMVRDDTGLNYEQAKEAIKSFINNTKVYILENGCLLLPDFLDFRVSKTKPRTISHPFLGKVELPVSNAIKVATQPSFKKMIKSCPTTPTFITRLDHTRKKAEAKKIRDAAKGNKPEGNE